MSGPVNLQDYGSVLRQIIPGAELVPGAMGGVVIAWHVRVSLDYDRAVNDEQASRMVTQLAEQVRHRAIRELGLEPVLDAMRSEVREFAQANRALEQANRSLQAMCDARAARIATLEEALEATQAEQP